MGYLTALAKTNLSGHLDYTDRNIVEKLFQTFTMRIGRLHETGTAVSQAPSAG
jgi:putative transposase